MGDRARRWSSGTWSEDAGAAHGVHVNGPIHRLQGVVRAVQGQHRRPSSSCPCYYRGCRVPIPSGSRRAVASRGVEDVEEGATWPWCAATVDCRKREYDEL
jgi:hypothetical protein